MSVDVGWDGAGGAGSAEGFLMVRGLQWLAISAASVLAVLVLDVATVPVGAASAGAGAANGVTNFYAGAGATTVTLQLTGPMAVGGGIFAGTVTFATLTTQGSSSPQSGFFSVPSVTFSGDNGMARVSGTCSGLGGYAGSSSGGLTLYYPNLALTLACSGQVAGATAGTFTLKVNGSSTTGDGSWAGYYTLA